jgi:hypothetical protein
LRSVSIQSSYRDRLACSGQVFRPPGSGAALRRVNATSAMQRHSLRGISQLAVVLVRFAARSLSCSFHGRTNRSQA